MQRFLPAAGLALALAWSAQAADQVKVGFVSTLSGPAAAIGTDIRDGFNLALKMNGGKLGGLPAEVIITDDQQNPEMGRQVVEKYLKREHVDFVTGIVFSNVLLAVAPAVFDNKTFLISANAARRREMQPVVLQRLLAERRRSRSSRQVHLGQRVQEGVSAVAELSGGQGHDRRVQAFLHRRHRR